MQQLKDLFIRRIYRRIYFFIRWLFFEKPFGLDFHSRDLSVRCQSGGRNSGYVSCPKSFLKDIFSRLSIDSQSSFLDVGCGKGFVLVCAAKMPFGKIEGIDIVSEFVEVAQKNLSILHLDDRIRVTVGDATLFDRYGEFDHIFLYNPFPAEIMSGFIHRLLESLDKSPRGLTVIYANPVCHSLFMEVGRFEIIHEVPNFLTQHKAYIYTVR